ncbi:hypothetical protein GGX14DRAFT_576090 [Mycena pura]|uniref:Uncharacterized protein n=1 Tax=Mycena pura TaxID=153505 RepID=A0AAD6Y5D1_9AGAR|nr:hypothetical protein GGX14DRAFT_576090 [Mycena pura]
MSSIYLPAFELPAATVSSSSTLSTFESPSLTFRERRGFTLSLTLAPPPFPNVAAKGELGPTISNLPRRKRSSVASIDLRPPAPAPAPVDAGRTEYFSCVRTDGPHSLRSPTLVGANNEFG